MENRKYACPKCGYKLLAREDDKKIFCLSPSCNWSIPLKRKEDLEKIPEIHKLKYLWE